MQLLFDLKLNAVDEKVCQTFVDKMDEMRDKIEKRMEETIHVNLKEEIESKCSILEGNTETGICKKVGNAELLIFEKIKELSRHLMKREEKMKQKMKNIEADVTKIRETLNDVDFKIDNIERGLYDFEINKKNNLIFYGVRMEENENMMNKIDDVLKEYLNIGRKIPLQRVSLIQKGIQTKRFQKIR